MTTKEEIRHRVVTVSLGYGLRGAHVATLAKDWRSVKLRHVWSIKDDQRVLRGVFCALLEYAQEHADGSRLSVKIYGKRGNLLGCALPRNGSSEVMSTTPEDFITSLPPGVVFPAPVSSFPHYAVGLTDVPESIRRDLNLAVVAGFLPADAKLWIRSDSSIFSIEVVSWSGAVLTEEYAAALMEHLLLVPYERKRSTGQSEAIIANARFWARTGYKRGQTLDPRYPTDRNMVPVWMAIYRKVQTEYALLKKPLDARLSREVNATLGLINRIADKRLTETRWDYRLEINCARLIAVAERGLRLEVDPGYADFIRSVERAAARLGRRVVRSICGEGGLEICDEEALHALLELDTEAQGRPLAYDKRMGRWVVSMEESPGKLQEES